MGLVSATLTVYFEEPFWVGVYERAEDGELAACRVVFGAEPRDSEVYSFFLENFRRLRFSPPVWAGDRPAREPNPKRAQREATRQLGRAGVGTKAQQALALQREQGKQARGDARRQRARGRDERRFELRRQKKKEKHRGR